MLIAGCESADLGAGWQIAEVLVEPRSIVPRTGRVEGDDGNCNYGPEDVARPPPQVFGVEGRELRRLGDLNPGWARTQTALAVRRHRPD